MSQYGGVILFVGLLLALWGNTAVQASADPPERTREVTPSPTAGPMALPTIDRLAAPPTVENPTQADEGAQLFWLNCQPCHGDHGQGLTDEWRAQYPPEDQFCWESGCHGERPYENGFTLPTRVPALIGAGSLERFETAGQVFAFSQAAMPYQAPGSLGEESYLAITAFLAREHGIWNGTPLRVENVADVRFRPAVDTPVPRAAPTTAAKDPVAQPARYTNLAPAALLLALPLLLGGLWLWLRHRS